MEMNLRSYISGNYQIIPSVITTCYNDASLSVHCGHGVLAATAAGDRQKTRRLLVIKLWRIVIRLTQT